MADVELRRQGIKVLNKFVTVWYPRGYTVEYYPELGLCLKGRGLNRNNLVTGVYFMESPTGYLMIKSADDRIAIKKFGTGTETTEDWLPMTRPYSLGLEYRNDEESKVKIVVNIR